MILNRMSPSFSGNIAFPINASPIATPACGISTKPILSVIFLSIDSILHDAYAPIYFPIILIIKYATPIIPAVTIMVKSIFIPEIIKKLLITGGEKLFI